MKPAHHQDFPSQAHRGERQLISAFVPTDGTRPQSATPFGQGGNPCLLLSLSNAPDSAPPADAEFTVCQSWPVTHHKQAVIAVRCYTSGGQAIECCGHGLLAAAHSWQRRMQCSELPLLMNKSLVLSWQQDDNTWLRFARLATVSCPVPGWVAGVLPRQQLPVAAAVCGDEHGYVVLQWPDGFSLRQLVPNLDALSTRSQRALICTSAQPRSGDAIQLRYFAPQYGVVEDTATGSALRVLADYWSPRFTHLTARQCSSVGGLLLARVKAHHVDVGGRCMIDDTT
jgi:predicted PhzF superfamily epimerase YddE/YHI9